VKGLNDLETLKKVTKECLYEEAKLSEKMVDAIHGKKMVVATLFARYADL
jgi:hypothetical protein